MAKKPDSPAREAQKKEILDRLAAGETLRQICKSPGFPTHSAIIDWVNKDADFADRYARARSKGLDVIAEEIIEIADEVERDTIETERGPVANSEWIARSRLRVDSRKWLLSKLRPDKYGDRTVLAGDPSAPIQSRHEIVFGKE